jgi:hypothetical protein
MEDSGSGADGATSCPDLSPDGAPPAAGTPFEQRWTCRVEPRGGRSYALRVSGSLHVSWAGRLAAGLAARHISVVRVRARRAPTSWSAEVELEVLDAGVEPSAIDFIALMRDEPPADPAPPPAVLTSFAVRPTARDVEVELRAVDSVGFLERVLRLFAVHALYAHEMRVDTVAGEAHDVFRLRNLSGLGPGPRAVAALERSLARLVR